MPVSFTPATVPHLAAHQRALKLDSGELFVVEIVKAPLAEEDAMHWIAFKVRAWQVTAKGAPVADREIPPFTSTVALAGLADGQTTIEDVVAQATAKAAEHFRNHLTAMHTLETIPRA